MLKRTRDLEEIKRRKMARSRFRKIIRIVSLNRIWLVDADDQKFSLNVKKNIAMIVRPQRKLGLLTMAEKSLIRTHHTLRTTENRKKLVNLMANLNCFSSIPPKVRARLSKCITFMVKSPGRILIKEGNVPLMVYFVLTGEVEVTKRVYDHITNTWVDRLEMINGPGDCLGHVEMIERCSRRHTYTCSNVVELLVVFEVDFESLLRPVMEKQWTEKKCAIMALDYFNFFTRDQIMNACKLCVLRQFEPLETIYYKDKGHMSCVHFVISGECMILQCLKMMVSQKKGLKSFELTDITGDDTSSMLQGLTNTELLKILREDNTSANKSALDIDELISSEEDENVEQTRKVLNLKKMDIKSIEIKCGLQQPSSKSEKYTTNSEKSETFKLSENIVIPFQMKTSIVIDEKQVENEYEELQKLENVAEKSVMTDIYMKEDYDEGDEQMEDVVESVSIIKKVLQIAQIRTNVIPDQNLQINKGYFDPEKKQQTFIPKTQTKNTALEDVPEEDSLDSKTRSSRTDNTFVGEQKVSPNSEQNLNRVSTRSGDISPLKRPLGNLENHFIDVGSLTFGSIFGLGEKLEHRVIMARTTVQCLMLPRFWLFEKTQNPGNIWQRRRFYLDSTIPSRQTLFKDFIATRQWKKFKKDLIKSHLNPYLTGNPTRIQDVPIICRIVEESEE